MGFGGWKAVDLFSFGNLRGILSVFFLVKWSKTLLGMRRLAYCGRFLKAAGGSLGYNRSLLEKFMTCSEYQATTVTRLQIRTADSKCQW